MTYIRNAALIALAATLVAGCVQQETGISQRHIHGIVTLPPLPLWEAEPTPKSEAAEDNNDDGPTADGPFSISYAYHIIRGTVDGACDAPEDVNDGNELNCSGAGLFGEPADADFYRIRSDYRGPIVFEARLAEELEGADIDLLVHEGDGVTNLYTDPNSTTQSIDDEGNPIEDEEGNAVLEYVLPRFATQVEDGDEFVVEVRVGADAETVDYEIVIVGDDPREHNIELGIEGDSATFDTGSDEPVILEALALKVGAFLSPDIDNLGNPVAGTSCEDWVYDEETESFWCAWDMVFAQQVTLESDVLLEDQRDGLDNDCNGVGDDGRSTADEDGDGFSQADGDCNDHDATIGPFRGDVAGDRKDNDCDGWADNGPDDEDNDGDGYCENGGADYNGDGVCRGPTEIGGSLGIGDCNDTDPTINPGLGNEIVNNSIDDNCTGGDGIFSLGEGGNTDDDTSVVDGEPYHWSDIEEEACGTDPLDPEDTPEDTDGDGYCDSECLGEVGCAQDTDGDGAHNWEEMQCGSDPEDAAQGPADVDLDGDGTCNGLDGDADGDGGTRQTQAGGDDCHDLDPTIRAHTTNDAGEVVAWNYDVVNGIDDDCDGIIDENRDWIRNDDGTFAFDDSYATADEDGDGYSLAVRDCDDTNPDVYLGNYETITTNIVNTDFATVHLFAADVVSLNSTLPQPNARRVEELVEFDLQKDRATWRLDEELWEEADDPPILIPTEAPVLHASFAKQPEVGKIWFEVEPNDVTMSGFGAGEEIPWADGHFQELGEAAGEAKTNELSGAISSIVVDSWDGDNDAFHVTFPEAGFVTASLDWEAAGDYDAVFYCYYFDQINAPNHYYIPFSPGLTDLSKPEEGTTIVPLPPGADCWFFVVGYSGGLGNWKLELTPAGND